MEDDIACRRREENRDSGDSCQKCYSYDEVLRVEKNKVTVFESRKPKFSELQRLVNEEIQRADWWDRVGEDLILLLVTFCVVFPSGLHFLGSSNPFAFLWGFAAMGFVHSSSVVKGAHMFSHCALGLPEKLNQFLRWFTVELVGAFPAKLAIDAHIQIHHPHTNIIGLGDSSSWKLPGLPRAAYMIFAPLFLPFMSPLFGAIELLRLGLWKYLLFQFLPSVVVGFGAHFLLLVHVSGLTYLGAFLNLWGTRALLSIPYIHVNIFQHIGLNMYDRENRPDRLILMATAVLNLPRNIILEYCFGHSLINCHVEHHLFPKLSDKMCLRVKPIVQKFFKDNGLVYYEQDYFERFLFFWQNFDELMVNGPPITEFLAVK